MEMKRYTSNKSCLNILRIAVMLATVVLTAAAAYFLSFIPTVMMIVISVFFVAGFFTALVYLPVYFRNMRYYVSREKIVKVSGFYFLTKQSVRVDKIQYMTTVSAPMRKLQGFNFIFIYTYGGMLPVMFVGDRDFAEICCDLKV